MKYSFYCTVPTLGRKKKKKKTDDCAKNVVLHFSRKKTNDGREKQEVNKLSLTILLLLLKHTIYFSNHRMVGARSEESHFGNKLRLILNHILQHIYKYE